MSPLLYVMIGLVGGGFVIAVIALLTRRGTAGSGVEADLVKRLEMIDRGLRDEFSRNREEAGATAKNQREELTKSLEGVRSVVDLRLRQLQEDNAKQIDEMRATVDEKLQGTLEKRLGESFKLVSDRLEQVHQGLGAMQQLASDVGGLQRVLTNVKTRGGWSEWQLGVLLEEMLTPDQFSKNLKTRDDTDERVEFAIKLPGDDNPDGSKSGVWLPIDAKFPMEHYERLAEAQEKGDPIAVDAAMKTLETQLKRCAKDICDKYINPPKTTDFALMFLPSEGLYAEAIRRVGLVQNVQRDCRVTFVGPTTLAALLNSLQMGFRTLAIQKRSSEVWNTLAVVKTEFGKFGEALSAVKEKIDQASRKMEDVNVRSRAITKRLRDVEELPTNPQPMLKDLLPNEDEEGIGQ
ncbi:MAG: DNA recombination protein RmuC [Verrucomicrobia bacterium]|nr:MAG: DNA recombination protein RmuC [Verrucomicrobiota bacterium]PYK65114.1 MAG: DNA recombination protein RmuC [Verrucomicrobiota bacterium]